MSRQNAPPPAGEPAFGPLGSHSGEPERARAMPHAHAPHTHLCATGMASHPRRDATMRLAGSSEQATQQARWPGRASAARRPTRTATCRPN
eukprot:7384487-Prymnesium_polylepis.1